jgi:hypothetical protein
MTSNEQPYPYFNFFNIAFIFPNPALPKRDVKKHAVIAVYGKKRKS